MSTKAKQNETQEKQAPIKTFREGAIAAHVWKRQTPTGFEYLDFSLSRSWKLKDGKREGYSTNFFDRNQEALLTVIRQASDYIAERSMGAKSSHEAQTAETSSYVAF